MKEISPKKVLREVAQAVPSEYRGNLVLVGSLAVAYHFFGQDEGHLVRTKDVDCLLCPHEKAQESGTALATKMLKEGWRHRKEGDFCEPRPMADPTEKLSAIRLNPPGNRDWFAELLAVPASEQDRKKRFIAVELEEGFYGLPVFEFLSLCAYRALPTEFVIRYSRPEMMALANLLSHPTIDSAVMSAKVDKRSIKRSNKDLGRILSIGRLAGPDEVEKWHLAWKEALQTCFPTRWHELAAGSGSGFRTMLESKTDFEEAHHTCVYGLLNAQPLTLDQLKDTGQRILQDAIEPLENEGASR